jgi:hypothetical protein
MQIYEYYSNTPSLLAPVQNAACPVGLTRRDPNDATYPCLTTDATTTKLVTVRGAESRTLGSCPARALPVCGRSDPGSGPPRKSVSGNESDRSCTRYLLCKNYLASDENYSRVLATLDRMMEKHYGQCF